MGTAKYENVLQRKTHRDIQPPRKITYCLPLAPGICLLLMLLLLFLDGGFTAEKGPESPVLETPNEDPLSSQVEGPEQAAPEEETPTEPSEEEEVWVDEPEDTKL